MHAHAAQSQCAVHRLGEGSDPNVCDIKIKTLFGRFLPNCQKNRGIYMELTKNILFFLFCLEETLLREIEVKKESSQVLLHFKNSPIVRASIL